MPKIKRESRQFIVINEEKLISEVQERPILYDKALKGYRKPAIRESAWQEVAANLESTVEECKKRWRSLRDAFMKQHKLFSRGDTSIKKRWLFYEQMEFLSPFIDGPDEKYITADEYIETINADGELVDASGHKLSTGSMNQQIVCISNDDNEYRHQIEIDEYNEEQLEEETLETTSYERLSTNKNIKNEKNVYILSGPTTSTSTSSIDPIQNARQSNKYGTQSNSVQNDPDERFLLSCLPSLKRLSNKKNALARLKIQQLLYDIEFDEYGDMSGQ